VKAVLLHLGWWGMRGKSGSGRAFSNKLGGVGSRADLEVYLLFFAVMVMEGKGLTDLFRCCLAF
jgi:hypothetical protein